MWLVAWRREVASVVCVEQVSVHLFHCFFSMPADSFTCHFGKEGIQKCGFDET